MRDEILIVLFRGVGGDTKLPSAPLREALTAAGFRDVVTYIATGNVVLATGLTAREAKARIAAVAKERLGFSKPVMAMTRKEWSAVVSHNPFPEAVDAPRTLHAFILDGKPAAGALEALAARATAGERVALEGKVLYLHAPNGFGASKLPPLIERTLGVATTARNWNTVLKLDALAKAAAAG